MTRASPTGPATLSRVPRRQRRWPAGRGKMPQTVPEESDEGADECHGKMVCRIPSRLRSSSMARFRGRVNSSSGEPLSMRARRPPRFWQLDGGETVKNQMGEKGSVVPRSRRRPAGLRLRTCQKSARKASLRRRRRIPVPLVTIGSRCPGAISRPRTKRAMPSAATKKWARPRGGFHVYLSA